MPEGKRFVGGKGVFLCLSQELPELGGEQPTTAVVVSGLNSCASKRKRRVRSLCCTGHQACLIAGLELRWVKSYAGLAVWRSRRIIGSGGCCAAASRASSGGCLVERTARATVCRSTLMNAMPPGKYTKPESDNMNKRAGSRWCT